MALWKSIGLIILLALLISCGEKSLILDAPQHQPALGDHYIQDLRLYTCQLVGEGMEAVENGQNDYGLEVFDHVLSLLLAQGELIEPGGELESLYKQIFDEIEQEERFLQAGNDDLLEDVVDEELIKAELPDQTLSDETVGEMENISDHFFFDAWAMENTRTAAFIHNFTSRNAKSIRKSLERSSQYLPMIQNIFKEECLPEDLCYLPIIESGYRTHANSRAQAVGIWQFVKGTAKMMGLKVNWWIDERRDPEASTRAAARYLNDLYREFDDWYLTLAAYNSGPGRVNRAIRKGRTRNFWELARKGLLPRETKNYIPSFMAAVTIAKDPESFGFTNLEYQLPVDTVDVSIDFSIELKRLARQIGISKDVLVDLNPALRHRVTPGGFPPYHIHVPRGLKQQTVQALLDIPQEERVQWKRYKIRKGDTLGRISRKMGVSVSSLMTVNKIRNARRLKIGQMLIIPFGPDEQVLRYAGSQPSETVTIRSGDTLSSIAQNYRTSVASILQNNPGIKPTRLRPGQKIVLTSSNRKRNTVHQRNFHIVKRGDNLYDIARAYGTSVQQLCSMNSMAKSKLLQPGDRIRIPYPHTKGTRNYSVRKGDTLSKIAKKFRVRLSDLLAWNSLRHNQILRIGQELVVLR